MKNLENLITHSSVFLVTDNKLDRSAWKRAMNGLGVHPDKIETFESFSDAICAMESRTPSALITSAEIKGQNAGEVMRVFRQKRLDRSEAFLGVLADESDGIFELDVLESEADVYLIKPYAANDLKESFAEAFKAKADMPALKKKVYKAFTLLESEDLTKAQEVVEKLEQKCSTLEIFVRLKAALLRKKGEHQEEAKLLKSSGLGSYQVLVQCFEAFVLDNNPTEAFEIASKILEKRSFHPKRISNYIKVCILTANYHSFIDFALAHLPVSTEENRQAMAAGLAISAQSIGLADKGKAIEAATLAIKHGKGNRAIIEKALRSLLELKQIKIVKRLSNELAEDESLAEALAVTDYIVLNLEGGEPFTLFRTGMDLTNRGVRDFHVYEILLKSAKLAGRKKESLDELADDASKHYPEKSEYFRSLIAA